MYAYVLGSAVRSGADWWLCFGLCLDCLSVVTPLQLSPSGCQVCSGLCLGDLRFLFSKSQLLIL